MLVVELARAQGGVVVLAPDDLLRQRRPVVRQVRLVADNDQFAVVPGLAQFLRRADGRQAGPDDHDRTVDLLGAAHPCHPLGPLRPLEHNWNMFYQIAVMRDTPSPGAAISGATPPRSLQLISTGTASGGRRKRSDDDH